EPEHEPVAQGRNVPVVDTGTPRPRREAVARQRRYDQIERWTVDSMCGRIGQQRHQRQQFGERARPAVAEDERYAPSVPRPFMYEVDGHAVKLGTELCGAVQRPLPGPPVETVRPVRQQLL